MIGKKTEKIQANQNHHDNKTKETTDISSQSHTQKTIDLAARPKQIAIII